MKSLVFAVFAAVLGPNIALAACPDKSPSTSNANFHSDDQRVNAKWLTENLAGRKVYFNRGKEDYKNDGSYAFSFSGKSDNAPGYKFYNSGMRCIDYPPKSRFDLYVVNNGKLIMIDSMGRRFEVTKIR